MWALVSVYTIDFMKLSYFDIREVVLMFLPVCVLMIHVDIS